MVDVISTRLQEVYGSFRLPGLNGEQNHPEERLTANALKRFGEESRRRAIQNKDIERKVLAQNLYQIKEIHIPSIPLPIKPITGLACRYCAPANSEVQLDPNERKRDVTDILKITQHAGWRPGQRTNIFDWGRWCSFLAQCVRLKRFPYIQLYGTVIKDDRVLTAIEQSARESVLERKQQHQDHMMRIEEQNDDADDDDDNDNNVHSKYDKFDENSYYEAQLKIHQYRAKKLLMAMRSKLSDLLLRITSWVLYKLLPCFLSGVVAHPAQIEMLKAATAKAPNAPLIFLPLHRSHLDYILVTFILVNNDIRSPLVAAGENLRIPFFGDLLRGLGAFYIKRKIDPIAGKKDLVYRAILHTYMVHALSAGHNLEFFIEGGRTRTGKPCLPKSGVLSVIVDAFMDGTIADALLVPVSVNYERLVDGNFIHEQLGQKKQPESFGSAVSAIWKILQSKFGIMRIDFNEPFSIRELVKSFNKLNVQQQQQQQNNVMLRMYDPLSRGLQSHASTSSLYGTDIVKEEHRTIVDSIARHVVYDCASATAVMTTNALAFLLLTRFRDGATITVLTEALDNLRMTLEGKKDIGFIGDSQAIIKYAGELLGSSMITIEKRGNQLFYKPVTSVPGIIELSYYSNSLVPHFALDSIMVTALNTLAKEHEKLHPDKEFCVSRNELINSCIIHCDLLRYEFVLNKPCQNIEYLLNDTLDRLQNAELITIPMTQYTRDQLWAHHKLRDLDGGDNDDDDDYDSDRLTNAGTITDKQDCIYLTAEGHCERLVLMAILAPFGYTYLAVASCLNNLCGTTMIESEFIKLCVKDITKKVDDLMCKYGESISTDSIRNCIKFLEKWYVIEITNVSGVRIVALCDEYNSMSGVSHIIQKIQRAVPQ